MKRKMFQKFIRFKNSLISNEEYTDAKKNVKVSLLPINFCWKHFFLKLPELFQIPRQTICEQDKRREKRKDRT